MMSQGQARSSSKIINIYNHNHTLPKKYFKKIKLKNWQPTDSLIGRKGTATGHNFFFQNVIIYFIYFFFVKFKLKSQTINPHGMSVTITVQKFKKKKCFLDESSLKTNYNSLPYFITGFSFF